MVVVMMMMTCLCSTCQRHNRTNKQSGAIVGWDRTAPFSKGGRREKFLFAFLLSCTRDYAFTTWFHSTRQDLNRD
jgi:hypothetical protein